MYARMLFGVSESDRIPLFVTVRELLRFVHFLRALSVWGSERMLSVLFSTILKFSVKVLLFQSVWSWFYCPIDRLLAFTSKKLIVEVKT